ncbi:MAG: hypothetical protein HY608_08185 [Planctomycetes bacterium]|nr:hypothetical protein [Planctomycetota bacterium]
MSGPRAALLLLLAAAAALSARASLARPSSNDRGIEGDGPPPLDARDIVLSRGGGTLEARTRMDPTALLERFRAFLRERPVSVPGVGPALRAWLTDARVLAISKEHLLAGRMDPEGALLTLIAFREPGAAWTWYSLSEDRGFLQDVERNGPARLASGRAGAFLWEVRRDPPPAGTGPIPLGEGEYALLSPVLQPPDSCLLSPDSSSSFR